MLLTGMGGFYNLKWHEGKLYGSDLGFRSGLGAVLVIDPASNLAVSNFATFPFEQGILSPSYLAFRVGARSFAPGSGPAGGSLLVAYSDFASLSRVAEIVPELYFVRGRVNRDNAVDISDAIALLSYLFLGGPPPDPLQAGDTNNDGSRDLSDAVYLLDYLFRGGPQPPSPFPEPGPAP